MNRIIIAGILALIAGIGVFLNLRTENQAPIQEEQIVTQPEMTEETVNSVSEPEVEESSAFLHEPESERRQWLRESQAPITWKTMAPGLEMARCEGIWETNIGDSYLTVVRADPELLEFVLLSGKRTGETKTAQQWCESEDLLVAMNAGMYQADHATNLGYMKIGDYENQSRFNSDNLFLAFGLEEGPAKLIDKSCHDWESLVGQSQFVTQSIRMMNCQGANTWSQQQKYWSVAAASVDEDGKLILIHSRSPWSMHDFVDMVRDLDLGLTGLIYLEGGPEASLYVNSWDDTFSGIGSYETGFFESDRNDRFWPIPNVIGVRVKN